MKVLFKRELAELQRIADCNGSSRLDVVFCFPRYFFEHSDFVETRYLLDTAGSLIHAVFDHFDELELFLYRTLVLSFEGSFLFLCREPDVVSDELCLLKFCDSVCSRLNFFGSDRLFHLSLSFDRILLRRRHEHFKKSRELFYGILSSRISRFYLPPEVWRLIFFRL